MPDANAASPRVVAFPRACAPGRDKPRIRLPVQGDAKLYAELTAQGAPLGHPRVTGHFSRYRSHITEILLLEGALTYEVSPYSLWIHVGSAAFRTDLEQLPSLQDFAEEVERYAAGRQPAKSDPQE